MTVRATQILGSLSRLRLLLQNSIPRNNKSIALQSQILFKVRPTFASEVSRIQQQSTMRKGCQTSNYAELPEPNRTRRKVRSDDSDYGTTQTPAKEIRPSDSSEIIIHYQERKENRHRVRHRQNPFKSLEKKYHHLVQKIAKQADGECERSNEMSLTDLPAEVIENILSYLVAPLSCYTVDSRPGNEKELKRLNGLSDLRVVLRRHPFHLLAATCHTLRIAVETFARHLLHQDKKLLCFEIVEQEIDMEEWQEGIRERNRLRRERLRLQGGQRSEEMQILPPYRLLWVRWSYCRCLFCGRQTSRRAIFNHFIWACQRCDKREWPKIVCPQSRVTKGKRANMKVK